MKLDVAVISFNMFTFDAPAVVMVIYSVQVASFLLFCKISHFHHLRLGACRAEIKANNQNER